jgi:hypothetical protein
MRRFAAENGSNLYIRDNQTGASTLLASSPGSRLFLAAAGGGEVPAPGVENLYDFSGDQLHLVDVLPDGTVPAEGAHAGGFGQPDQNLVSSDGPETFFQVNLARVAVQLPHTEFLAQGRLHAGPSSPPASAPRARSTATPKRARRCSPNRCGVRSTLRSSSHKLPDLVAALKGQIEIDLDGRIDSHNRGIRTTFATIPDAPISSFTLDPKGGVKSLLETARRCAERRAPRPRCRCRARTAPGTTPRRSSPWPAASITEASRWRVGTLGTMAYPLANALYQWEEGARELAAIGDPRRRRLADRVIDAIRVELRRRIGPTFSADELADLYGKGTDWAQQIAIEVAPGASDDAHILADAAFWAYLRGAGDYAGGRTLA